MLEAVYMTLTASINQNPLLGSMAFLDVEHDIQSCPILKNVLMYHYIGMD